MKRLPGFMLLLLLVFFTTGNSGRISSANNTGSEILSVHEALELTKILDYGLLRSLDSLTDLFSIQKGFSGNVLVAIDGFDVFEKSLRYADPILKTPLSTSSVFQLASVSKQFTAAAIMLLKADQRLDFDDELVKYIPELPYKKVTIRHLLHHTGGLPNYMYLVDKYWNSETHPDNEDVIGLMAKYKLPVFFQPGARYDYSNTGYVMLASVVERVSGMSLNEFLQRRVFGPIGMKNSYVYSSADTSIVKNHIDGFRALKRGYTRIADTKNNGPVGDKGVCSTLGDLYLWDQALYNGSPIPFEILEEAFLPAQSNAGKEIPYGYGFRLRNFENEPVIYHNGVWEGFRTNFHRYPLHRNTIIVLNNSSSRVNHELLTAIETLISRESKKDFTKMLVNISIEEGAESAVEVAKELRLVNPGAGYNLRTMMKAAEFLESSGKPGKAGEVKSLIEKLS